MDAFELSMDLTRLERPNGQPFDKPLWMEQEPRKRGEKLLPQGAKPPPPEVSVLVLRGHVHDNRWRNPGDEYVTTADRAQDLSKTGHVKFSAPAGGASGWCSSASSAALGQQSVDADGWKRIVTLEATRRGVAGRHINAEVGEQWTDSLREAARSVASGSARIVDELNDDEKAYVDRCMRDSMTFF